MVKYEFLKPFVYAVKRTLPEREADFWLLVLEALERPENFEAGFLKSLKSWLYFKGEEKVKEFWNAWVEYYEMQER